MGISLNSLEWFLNKLKSTHLEKTNKYKNYCKGKTQCKNLLIKFKVAYLTFARPWKLKINNGFK